MAFKFCYDYACVHDGGGVACAVEEVRRQPFGVEVYRGQKTAV